MSTILLVDDDAGMRTTLAELLALDGHRVEAADTAEAALAQFAAHTYDLVILDQRMEGMSGMQVMDRLLASNPNTRIIMMSAFAGDSLRAEALSRGVLAFVDKPLELDIFLAMVRDADQPAVLVVTDDSADATIPDLLCGEGFRVTQVASLSAADRVSGQMRFDAAIFDGSLALADTQAASVILQQMNPHCATMVLAGKRAREYLLASSSAAANLTVIDQAQAVDQLTARLAALRAG